MVKPGWNSRGYLPHYDVPDLVQFVTFRLADSFPKAVLRLVEEETSLLPESAQVIHRSRRIERLTDTGYGACHLRRPEIARIVEETILGTDGEECLVLAWCVMPNHVHVLAEPQDQVALADLVSLWKGRSAIKINRILGRSGSLWYREYHDRFMRTYHHMARTIRYIEENPVKVGLCREPVDWPFGSARFARDCAG